MPKKVIIHAAVKSYPTVTAEDDDGVAESALKFMEAIKKSAQHGVWIAGAGESGAKSLTWIPVTSAAVFDFESEVPSAVLAATGIDADD